MPSAWANTNPSSWYPGPNRSLSSAWCTLWRYAYVNAIGNWSPARTMRTRWSSPSRGHGVRLSGLLPRRSRWH